MFVLMLYEPMGDKKVPVMIGEHEAEMIILEQEQRQAYRPMTYQLIISLMHEFNLHLELVRINRFAEGIFYASLIVSDGFNQKEIDAHPSDAVVLALNLSVDIEMADKVIEETHNADFDEIEKLKNTLTSERSRQPQKVKNIISQTLDILMKKFRGLTEHITMRLNEIFRDPVRKESLKEPIRRSVREQLEKNRMIADDYNKRKRREQGPPLKKNNKTWSFDERLF